MALTRRRTVAGLVAATGVGWLLSLAVLAQAPAVVPTPRPAMLDPTTLFDTSDNCMACHNGLTAPSGQDVSIGVAWRATIMANSGRDPYWQASVRREILDHPGAAATIEDECAACHIPMAHTVAHAAGREARVFANIAASGAGDAESRLARDGVSCTVCHQITPANFGTRDSFNGGFVIDTVTPREQRSIYGPYPVEPGLSRVMHSVTGFVQQQGLHVRESELCATCHTLYTKALAPDGTVIGELPEQMPFLEWQQSRYRDERSCQSCHMPPMPDGSPIASVLGSGRDGAAQHTFLGGNAFMLRMLNRFRTELGVEAPAQELEAAALATERHLRDQTATLAIDRASVTGNLATFRVRVENRTGHKFPTAYPSRRAWLHVSVRDAAGRIVFESGAVSSAGAIAGNDNDDDADAFEPHYRRIVDQSQVQIYESILRTLQGGVTTGLLHAVGFAKDNRLLPDGFDKRHATKDVAVHGDAGADDDFVGGSDQVEYEVRVPEGGGPFSVDVELLFQPIAFRWADNLTQYDAVETRRFSGYVRSMQGVLSSTVARASLLIR